MHLLENDAVVLAGVRFAGATLWTDYAIFGAGSEVHTMAVCRDRMNDHRRITWRKQPWLRFRPQEALGLHRTSRTCSRVSWRRRSTARPSSSPTTPPAGARSPSAIATTASPPPTPPISRR